MLVYLTAHDRRYGANFTTFSNMDDAKREKWAAYVANNPHLPLSQVITSTAVELRLKGQL